MYLTRTMTTSIHRYHADQHSTLIILTNEMTNNKMTERYTHRSDHDWHACQIRRQFWMPQAFVALIFSHLPWAVLYYRECFCVKSIFVSHGVKFACDFYPEIYRHRRFHLLYFYLVWPMVLDHWHTNQNRNERLIVEGAINQFFYDTAVVTIANIFGESWFRIPVHVH